MANHSHSTITFQWEPYIEKYILEVEPPFGELGKIAYKIHHVFILNTLNKISNWSLFKPIISGQALITLK